MNFAFKNPHCYFLILFLNGFFGNAQPKAIKYEVGINAGTFVYQGDLTPTDYGSFKTPALVVGITGNRWINNVFAWRFDLNIGKLRGDDARYKKPEWRQQRAFAFKAAVKEVIVSGVYQPLGRSNKWAPYLFAGAGLSVLKITRDFSNFNPEFFSAESLVTRLATDLDHPLPKIIPIVPVGVGFRYSITDQFSINTEASYRVMRTDYLDGFSVAANPDLGDHYFKYSLGLLYSFTGKSKYDCPVIKY